MPKRLVLTAPRTVEFHDYEEPSLAPDQVRIETILSACKNGTEMTSYRGTSPFAKGGLDPVTRLFQPFETERSLYPSGLGNWGMGRVIEVGPEAKRFRKGDRVHGGFGHRPTHAISESRLFPLGDLLPEAAMLVDPAEFALAIVHDAEVKVGDHVAVFGLGAIGLMIVEIAKLQGARTVIAVDRVSKRLEVARGLGADELINPDHGDVGTVIKELTGGKGVDVAIEISGSTRALHECIRCVHIAGLVVAGAYYQGDALGLRLGEEWHHNRPTLKSSMAVWGCPHRCHPMWNEPRIVETVIHLLATGKLRGAGIITHRYPYEQAGDAYALIDQASPDQIKSIVTYS